MSCRAELGPHPGPRCAHVMGPHFCCRSSTPGFSLFQSGNCEVQRLSQATGVLGLQLETAGLLCPFQLWDPAYPCFLL